MNYELVIVDDDELPIESGWVIVRTPAGSFLLVTQTTMATCSGWGVAWRASEIVRHRFDGPPAPQREAWWSLLPPAVAS